MTGEEELVAEVTGVGVEAGDGGEAVRVSILLRVSTSSCNGSDALILLPSWSDLLLRNCQTQR